MEIGNKLTALHLSIVQNNTHQTMKHMSAVSINYSGFRIEDLRSYSDECSLPYQFKKILKQGIVIFLSSKVGRLRKTSVSFMPL